MKIRFLVPTLAALLSVSACDKGKNKEGEPASPAKVTAKAEELVSSDDSVLGSTAPALDVAKTNELWSLAPTGTILGMVAAPGSAATLHSMMMGVIATAESRPMGAKLLSEMREELAGEIVNILDPASIAEAGIDLSGSAALFAVAKKKGYMLLPVTNRDAFRKVTKAKVETTDGLEVDRLDDDLVCTTNKDRYLCASSVALLKEFGSKVDGPLAKRVAALPLQYRGQAEFVMDVASMKDFDDEIDMDFDGQFSDPQLGIGTLRFGNGAITARGWFQAKALDKVAAAAAVPNGLGNSLASSKPSGLFSFRMPVPLIVSEMPPNDKKVAGLDLKKDVVGNLTGEFVGYTPQSEGLWGRLAIGLKDAAPFKELLNMGCGMAPAMGIPGIEVTPADGKCSAMIDVAKLPLPDPTIAKMFKEPVSIIAEVKADRFEITFGKESPTTDKPMSAMGKELLSQKWSFSMWTEGMGLASGPEMPWNEMPAAVPSEVADGIKMAVWMLSHVYEVGMAGGVRDDGVHGILHIATYAGDAPEVLKAYQAAVTKTLSSGKATEDFEAIRKKWPNSMAARGGTGGGSMMIAGVTGMLGAIAVPAFMKYQQKSIEAMGKFEEREAQMQEELRAAEGN
ncbi:MAG: hypothetical protein GY811_15625 [Myxococcales bacterium]|nr:hypothetical protein [Myxococcales bacterium]